MSSTGLSFFRLAFFGSASRLSALIFLLSAVSLPAATPGKAAFGLDAYSALHRAHALAVSPDGKSVLFVVTFDGDKGPAKQEWHIIDVSGENNRKLDLPASFKPQGFTRDGGSLFGNYEVDGKAQLGIVPLFPAGASTQIIALPNGIKSAVISPDGARFALTADSRAKDPLATVRHIIENGVTSLYVVRADGAGGAWWCPKLKDITDVAWSQDSSQLAVITQSQKIGHHDVHSRIFLCDASGARPLAKIDNATSGLAWVNNGKDLVFAGTTTNVLTPDHLWSVPAAGGAPVDLTLALAGSITNVSNDPHGTAWVEMHKGTVVEIDSYRDGKLAPAYHWPNGSMSGAPAISGFAAGTDALAFTVGDPSHADNVAVVRGSELRRITHEGDHTLAKVALGEVRVVDWTAKDGTKLQGILTLPANYVAGKKYPFLVLPHGGPEANDTLRFDTFSRFIAGLGYVVLQPEYRGSTGYGTDFLEAIYQHFGDRAYSDVDSATDFAIAQGWADPARLAIFGWSAGGFMTSWTVTQTHRYKAAIEGAGITDWLSFIPTSDIAQVDYDMRLQEKNPAPMLQFSAVMYADQVTTPLLILHGESDIRVPTFQGREFFILLAERGKTARMVTYPGSPHFPRLAEQRRNVFTEIMDWLAKYNP